jgi:plasmid maintenance system antidote protein VapI
MQPHEVFLRYLEGNNIEHEDVVLLGISSAETFLFLKGFLQVDSRLARGLSLFTDTSEEFWLNLEESYDKWHWEVFQLLVKGE